MWRGHPEDTTVGKPQGHVHGAGTGQGDETVPGGGQEAAGTGVGHMGERAGKRVAGEAVGAGAGTGIAVIGMPVTTVPAGVGAEAGIIPARETDTNPGQGAGQEPPRGPRSIAGPGLSAPRPRCPKSRGGRAHLRRQVKLLVSAVVRQLPGKLPTCLDTCTFPH